MNAIAATSTRKPAENSASRLCSRRRSARAHGPADRCAAGSASGSTSAGCANPRIEVPIRDVGQQVEHDVTGRGEQNDALDQRVVLGQDGVDCKPATVTIGISAFLSAWRKTTARAASPLDRAVVMYWALSASSMAARVSLATRATPS